MEDHIVPLAGTSTSVKRSGSRRGRPGREPAAAAPAARVQSAVPDGKSRYLNRELSLLEYDSRILARAEDDSLSLAERLMALHYFCGNLDDFFQIRVAGLKAQDEAAPAASSPDGLSPGMQLREIRHRVEKLLERQTQLWRDELLPRLAAAGVRVVDATGLNQHDAEHLASFFQTRIFPVLTPLAVDPSHPFPYISHFSLNLAVVVRDPLRREQRFARLKVPPLLPRFVALPGGERFVPVEQVIAAHLQALFPGMEVISHAPFRLTRDNDVDVRDSEADDLLVSIQSELLRHRRRARAARLEVTGELPDEVRELLLRELELEPGDVYVIDGLLGLGSVDFFAHLERLQSDAVTPLTPAPPAGVSAQEPDLLAAIHAGDILVHHPYDSFASSVVAFIQQAAVDPHVLAIKQTLYRTSGPASPIVMALVRAAEAGKQVVALIELKARGDELANIEWAQHLEEAGVHVVYGVVGLKTHAKLVLVVRQEGEGIQRYVHVATGNYNPSTAKGYEDIGLFSCDPVLGADVGEVFNLLTGYSRQRRFQRLLVAPVNLRAGLLELIRDEAGRSDGRIVIKVNNLVDQEIIDALYAASQGGVHIDLLVRGICCLRPGVPGLSDRIRVRSLIGRFLEHSRILRFGSDRRGPKYFIGSPDLMERNLDRRIEALVPVTNARLQRRLGEILDTELADDRLAWELDADGNWHRVKGRRGVNSHERFIALANQHVPVDDAAIA